MRNVLVERKTNMKRDLLKLRSIFLRIVCLCVISFCFLGESIKVHAARQIDPDVEREVKLFGTHFVMVSDGEAMNSSTTETKNKMVQNQAWEPPPPPPDPLPSRSGGSPVFGTIGPMQATATQPSPLTPWQLSWQLQVAPRCCRRFRKSSRSTTRW